MMTMMERSTSSLTTNSSSVLVAMDDPTEISIFDAQKYFNDLNLLQPHKSTSVVNGGGGGGVSGGGNRVSPLDNVLLVEASRFSSASSSIDSYSSSNNNNSNTHRNSYMKNRSFRSAATPTASSEASWNSQTGLLSAPPGSVAVSLRNPALSSSADKRATTTTAVAAATTPFSGVRWLNLRRKCPCSCKKSVQVKEKSVRTISESHFPIPQIVLPPSSSVHGHVVRGGSGSGSGSTNGSIKSTMAEIRSGTIGNTSSFEETWGNAHHHHQSRRNSSRNSRGSDTITRSLSPSSAREMSRNSSTNDHVNNGGDDDDDDDPLKLKVLHGRSSTGGFTFPILNSSSSSSPIIKMTLLKDPVSMASSGINPIPEDPARDSLEIFSPPSHSNRKTHRSHHQLQIQPTNNFTFQTTSPTSRARTNNTTVINNTTDVDDGASDASSDLFEIESFSTQTTATTTTTTTSTATTAAHPSMFLYHRQRRDTLEEAAGLRRFAPNSTVMAGLYHRRTSLEDAAPGADYGYEPSEASIDWSVTTAEGFDRANASEADYGEYLSPVPPHAAETEKNRRKSSGNGLLMSCRCEKAVSVGPGPRPMSRPGPGGGGGGEHGRAMWAVGHKG
ncbi:uncharacterized protein LOC133824818 [Humulus lupulus]|uniref:uncharacterized protein LOC133824818 n=1 Tax=Humulus lupulus TaxID=3486 RepID=UPI002B406CDC|nr:uncharacterized protein LOC133824818 [Humulus lupulus]